ncbi:hypothetical protein NON20_13665 [Synechocystis sp. B12]|nr:hypothetical protein NON20_13665 [Synechocystis sp. B12]
MAPMESDWAMTLILSPMVVADLKLQSAIAKNPRPNPASVDNPRGWVNHGLE